MLECFQRFRFMDFYDIFVPWLFNHMKEAPSPLKKIASHCMVTFLWHQCLTNKREIQIEKIIQEFALNKKFIHWKTYVDVFEASTKIFSKPGIKMYFSNMFYEMGKDKVHNVKIKFCDAVPTFMSIINKNKDTEEYL